MGQRFLPAGSTHIHRVPITNATPAARASCALLRARARLPDGRGSSVFPVKNIIVTMLAFHSAASTAFTVRAPMNIKMQAADAAVEVTPPPPTPLEIAKGMPGITDPLGFFDPLGYCTAEGVTEGKVRFFREA